MPDLDQDGDSSSLATTAEPVFSPSRLNTFPSTPDIMESRYVQQSIKLLIKERN